MKNLQPLIIGRALSTVFVEMERTLKSDPQKSVEDFCNDLDTHPNEVLYSHGFQALLIFSALVPLKEVLDSSQVQQNKWENLRIARNSICHGSYEFLDDGKVKFQDLKNKSVIMEPKEIVNLSNELIEIYLKSLS